MKTSLQGVQISMFLSVAVNKLDKVSPRIRASFKLKFRRTRKTGNIKSIIWLLRTVQK